MPDDLRILDIGANIGVFSIFAREQLPEITILAIEPYPPTYELLNRNLASNNLGQTVRTRNIAISGQSGEVSFQSSPAIPSHSRKISEFPAEESVAIQCLTLANLFESENLDEIDFIKIDIEGAEYDVLLSSSFETLRKGKRYGIEYHGRGPDELTSHFGHAGFSVTDHPKKGQSGIIEFTRLEQFPRV